MSLEAAAFGLNLGASILGFGASQKSKKEQRAAYKESLREKREFHKASAESVAYDIEEVKRQGKQTQHEQAAAMGAAGATIGAGTPLQVQMQTAQAIEADVAQLTSQMEYHTGEAEHYETLLTPAMFRKNPAMRQRYWEMKNK